MTYQQYFQSYMPQGKFVFRSFGFLLFLVCLTLNLAPAIAAQQTLAKQALLMDFETGVVFYKKNAHERMPTSSMSKTMTLYMVFEALENGSLSLDDKLQVSEKAWRKGGSKMFVEVDKQVRVEDLIRGVAIQSGNDATIVLAEGLGGSEENYAKTMTARAHDLGMTDSNFVNASGWPDDDHYSTAYDLALLARALIKNFPKYYTYFGEKDFTYNGIKQTNRNPLLYRDIGADGVKTGHTEAGGYGVIGSGVRDGRRVILVVNGLDSSSDRARESAKLLDWGLRAFANETLFAEGQTVETVKVALGTAKSAEAVLDKPLVITYPRAEKNNITIKAKFDEPLQAPIKTGDEIGSLSVSIPGQDEQVYPLYAKNDIAALNFFAAGLERLKMMVMPSSE